MKGAGDMVTYKVRGTSVCAGSWERGSMWGTGKQCACWVLKKQSQCLVFRETLRGLGGGHMQAAGVAASMPGAGCLLLHSSSHCNSALQHQ